MLYFHAISVISAIKGMEHFPDLGTGNLSGERLFAIEPGHEQIPRVVLRRMGKAVRLMVGAGLPLIKQTNCGGVIVGTANGGMEDCIRFMNQIVQYEEGMLAPGNFVQSTPNGLASQLAFMAGNKGYNCTHSHRGLSFENALRDAEMLTEKQPDHFYLLGAADEISTYNYNIDRLAGWYKEDQGLSGDLFSDEGSGALAGEGAAAFLVSGSESGSVARLEAMEYGTLHSYSDLSLLFKDFLKRNHADPDWLIQGENGDVRFRDMYRNCESIVAAKTGVARYKHLCGEYPTASAIAVALTCKAFESGIIPEAMVRKKSATGQLRQVAICNAYQGGQYSFSLLSQETV